MDSLKRIEILAPAGGREQLEAAVRCGADAVYLGTGSFNARRNAENFEGDGLRSAVSYAHARGTDIHVTVNTLVYDSELEALERDIDRVAESGADAVIIQDLAVLRVFTNRYPTVKRHASTQMTVHNTDGAKLMRDLGFDRVVLSRELSLKEIEKITGAVDIETEVFIHGALCMSCSGGCYLSAMLGGRSGNRGLCAQPCRLDFRSGKREYALSLKDMSHIQYLRELSDMGVRSAKIEGRMKRPEYVAAAVTACRRALDGEEYDIDSLRAVFSRSGFTDGYAVGKRDLTMFGYRRHEDVKAAEGVLGELAGLYRRERQSVGVNFSLRVSDAKPVTLSASDGTNVVNVTGNEPQEAVNRPTDEQSARASLSKTGGTPFYMNTLAAQLEPGLTVPSGEMNALRREALDRLLSVRETVTPHERKGYSLPALGEHTARGMALHARFAAAEQIPEYDFDRIILPADEIIEAPALLDKYAGRLVAELPTLLFPDSEDRFIQRLSASGIKSVLANNLYGIYTARRLGLAVYGGYGLNVINSQSADALVELGVRDITLSWEVQMKRAARLSGEAPRGLIVYGRLPLMSFRACPAQGERGCGDCSGKRSLRDRKGVEFPVRCRERRYSQLLNSVPLFVSRDRVKNVDFAVLYFTDETQSECRRISELFLSGGKYDAPHTGGLYFRDVL